MLVEFLSSPCFCALGGSSHQVDEDTSMTTPASAELFTQLQDLYQQLEQALPEHQGNPCGTCKACCTAEGVSRQSLTDLELDYIADRVGPDITHAFRAYTAREKDAQGQFLFEVCPYYSEELQGCGIHQHRPFACRAYGPYRLEGTIFPEDCVFIGHEKLVPRGKGYLEIPLAREVRDLSRAYWPHTGPRIVAHTNQANLESSGQLSQDLEGTETTDELDKAFIALALGQTEVALEELQKPRAENEEAFRLHHLGLVLTTLERHQEARVVLDQCLKLAPQSWELHYNLALNSFKLGDHQNAVAAFLKTVELNPLHGLAWGFLGYLALSRKLLDNAVEFFENATRVDPENATFRLRLGTTYAALGKAEQARTQLQLATELSGPVGVAEEARSALVLLQE